MKKKMTRAIYSFFLILGLVVVLGMGKSVYAQWDDPTNVTVTGKAEFQIEDGILINYLGDKQQLKEVVIPSDVVAIAEEVFRDCTNLETVVLPDGVESFGEKAFEKTALSTMAVYEGEVTDEVFKIPEENIGIVVLPSRLNSIEQDTFSLARCIQMFGISNENENFTVDGQQTKEIIWEDEKSVICGELLLSKDKKQIFRMAPAYSVNGDYAIMEGVEKILPYSFESNMGGNRRFLIPDSLVSIGDYAFYGCNNLNGIVFGEQPKLTTIGAFAFAENPNISTDPRPLVFPNSVKKIGESCFKNCVNMEVDISNTSIESIPKKLFVGCVNIHTVVLPKTVKILEAYAFCENDNLNEIIFLGKNLEKIGTAAFKDCNNLHSIKVPEGIVNIENGTFDGCWNLEKIILPNSTEIIGDNAFRECRNIKKMKIPKNVKHIANSSFTGAKVDAIDTSKNEYAQGMVKGFPKRGKKVTISGVQYVITKSNAKQRTVKAYKASSKKISKVVVKDSIRISGMTYKVTEISKNTFKGCTRVKSITIGKNVSKIGTNAFYGCKKLKTITVKTTKLTLKSTAKGAFKGIAKTTTIKVPKKKLASYKKIFKSKGISSSVKIKA